MGCDIHILAEKKDLDWGSRVTERGDGWNILPFKFSRDRWYALFSVLADVRNAGDIVPISQPRGLPSDWSKEKIKIATEGFHYDFGLFYLDEAHSTSWLTFKEVLDYNKSVDISDFKEELMNCMRQTDNFIDEANHKPENYRIVFNFDN